MKYPANAPLHTLNEIHRMMESSSRFISLSGLSGVAAGITALIGAAVAYYYFGVSPFQPDWWAFFERSHQEGYRFDMRPSTFLLLNAGVVLLVALGGAFFFTQRRAKRKGQAIWGPLTWRLLINLAIPLVAGGVCCLAMMYHHHTVLVAPMTLIFYGMALLNASKYTLPEIRWLGLSELALGLVGLFFLGYGLDFWSLGFGVLHIVYGGVMYWRYER